MTFIYNLSIRVYTFLIRVVAPFNEKARLWIRGRKGLLSQMAAKIDGSKPVVWFHSSSLGEFEQGSGSTGPAASTTCSSTPGTT